MNKYIAVIESKLLRGITIIGDKAAGYDFERVVHPEEVGSDPEVSYRSSPSGDRFLRRVLKRLQVNNSDTILDIGCGKGSAMRTFVKFPFRKIDGIEISPELARIAKRNFRRMGESRISVFESCATKFAAYSNYSIIYLYNPFPCSVLKQVFESVLATQSTNGHERLILYNNPVCSEAIVATGQFRLAERWSNRWGNGIAVLTDRSENDTRLKLGGSFDKQGRLK